MKNGILIVVVERVERAQDTGKPGIFSKSATKSYSEGWDRIFGMKHAGSDLQHASEDSNLCSICNDKSKVN